MWCSGCVHAIVHASEHDSVHAVCKTVHARVFVIVHVNVSQWKCTSVQWFHPSVVASEFRSNDQCLECSDACETCYGPLSDQCLQCHSELFLKDGLCLEHCPDGYYPSENRCHPCSDECETCFGEAFISNRLLSCIRSFLKLNVSWYIKLSLPKS